MSAELQVVMPALDELTATARYEHEMVLAAGVSVVEHAILAGEALLTVRGMLPFGKFEDWMVEQDYSLPTVRQYMRIARHKRVVLHNQPPTIRSALLLVQGERPSNAPAPEVVAEAKRLRSEGLTYRAIAEELNVNKNAIAKWCNPKAEQRRLRRAHERTMTARRAANREERARKAKAAGGGFSEAYSLMRRTAQILDRLSAAAESQEIRKLINGSIARLHTAEDGLMQAIKEAS